MDRILSLEGLRKFAVKLVFLLALGLGCCLAVSPGLYAQSGGGGKSDHSGQSKPDNARQSTQKSAPKTPATQSPSSANPFPTDLSTVPVIPAGNAAGSSVGSGNGMGNGRYTLPDDDADPVPSPDDSAPGAANGQGQGYSSSLSGLGPLLPNGEGNVPGKGKQPTGNGSIAPMPQPSAKKDVSVGKFYLDTHDWKGASSRFQSALVLDPSNAEAYWGLAEAERNLGQYAAARANYLKVLEYDAGGKYAKKALKALKKREIVDAKPSGQTQQ